MVTPKLLRVLPVAAAAAALLIGAGCSSSSRPATATSTTSTTATGSSTTLPTGPTSTTAPGSTTTTVSAGATLPPGFKATDLTWISDNEGWALGSAPCTRAPCTSIAHTLDGGRSWAGLPAPKAYLQSDAASPGCSTTVACVGGIRFVTAKTGYAFGMSSLWLTTDGAHTWSLRSTDSTDALEASHSTVVRVTHSTAGCPPGCTYRVQVATVGSTSWQLLAAPALIGDRAALAREGSDMYVAAFGHTAGGAQDAHTKFARSTDDGAHWSTLADPCGTTPSGNEADATAISAAPSNFLAVACTARMAGEAGFVVVSADAGATFGPHRGGLLNTVPADGEQAEAIAAATGARLALVVRGGGNRNIVVTNDAGVDWTVTHSETAPDGVVSTPYVGFQDATTGRAVIDPRAVLTTTDGGGHWTAFTFP